MDVKLDLAILISKLPKVNILRILLGLTFISDKINQLQKLLNLLNFLTLSQINNNSSIITLQIELFLQLHLESTLL